jgi:hypothetical protein
VNATPKPTLSTADIIERHIKRAWIAAIVSGSITLLVVLSALAGAEIVREFNAWSHTLAAPKSDRLFPQKRKRFNTALLFTLCALAICAVAIFFFGLRQEYQTGGAYQQSTPEIRRAISATPSADTIPFVPDGSLTPAEIFRRARPSVVLLTMQDARGQPISLGSGFFVEKHVVATNFHVIDEAAGGYAEVFGQPTKANIQGIIALDVSHDLALLQLEASAPPLPVAPKLSVNIGDPVYAIGNPLGLEGTFSPGVVSSVRKVDSVHLVQITAPISPDSSGGPVLDQTGTVVGVSFASIEKGQNLNFAIPSDYLAALQVAKTEPRPFVAAIPRAKPRTTLLDRIGNERLRSGVVGENFSWELEKEADFSFSLRNKLAENVSRVQGFVLFFSPDGEPLDSVPFDYEGIILTHSAKRIDGKVASSVWNLCHPADTYYWWDRRARTWRKADDYLDIPEDRRKPGSVRREHREGKVEFRILDFSVE